MDTTNPGYPTGVVPRISTTLCDCRGGFCQGTLGTQFRCKAVDTAVTVKAPNLKTMVLPTAASARKGIPLTTGVLDYFPLALAEVARLSKAGNDQHNPGKPLHWDRTKSLDHADCIGRHLIDRGSLDEDGQRHSAKLAWRALALLQTELEAAALVPPAP